MRHKGNRYLVHRLVAIHFIDNQNLLKTQVNHKDLNGLNNHYTNLEWTTPSENVIHGHYTRKYQTKSISLIKNGVTYHFNSINDAKRAGASAINRLLNGTQLQTNGFILI